MPNCHELLYIPCIIHPSTVTLNCGSDASPLAADGQPPRVDHIDEMQFSGRAVGHEVISEGYGPRRCHVEDSEGLSQ